MHMFKIEVWIHCFESVNGLPQWQLIMCRVNYISHIFWNKCLFIEHFMPILHVTLEEVCNIRPLFVQFHRTVFRAQEPKAPVTYCDHALSGVRPSIVCRPSSFRQFTFSTSSPEPLDWFWWNLIWMKYSKYLTSVVVFQPDPPRGGSRAGPNKVTGVPLLQRTFSSDRKSTATN